MQVGESSSRASVGVDEAKLGQDMEKNRDDEQLQAQAAKLTEILGLNPSRKLDWSRFDEKEKTVCWDSDLVKKLKKGGVPLDYIEPKEKDGVQIVMVMDTYYHRIWKHLNVNKVILLPTGLFVIRFKTLEERDEALLEPVNYLGANHVILKLWKVEREDDCRRKLKTPEPVKPKKDDQPKGKEVSEWRVVTKKGITSDKLTGDHVERQQQDGKTNKQQVPATIRGVSIKGGNSFTVLDVGGDEELGEEVESAPIMTKDAGELQEHGHARSDNPLDPSINP
ncbi:OLC1v1016483C1 [Oldenlandia corymbosa var. corymbosa]|uniref:OLC1v1016483C1 n=1 Tax=Oldenlandia corymbosa var. corymbosa TaxID=529605 RepID=A0AAV1E7I1_OLDCO|nr:OLC1v1016483C1 [Oldenlandia corymbosa var. corymbosa]